MALKRINGEMNFEIDRSNPQNPVYQIGFSTDDLVANNNKFGTFLVLALNRITGQMFDVRLTHEGKNVNIEVESMD